MPTSFDSNSTVSRSTNSPHVLYGVTNEPSDVSDEDVLTAMNNAVDAIRSMEPSSGPHHLISVQGTRDSSRDLTYYRDHPVTAAGGVNVIYETHLFSLPDEWQAFLIEPANTLPIIIAAFGPVGGLMSLSEAIELSTQAELHEVPYLGWSFSAQCAPCMLQSIDSVTDCTTGATTPTEWGNAFKAQLAQPWASR